MRCCLRARPANGGHSVHTTFIDLPRPPVAVSPRRPVASTTAFCSPVESRAARCAWLWRYCHGPIAAPLLSGVLTCVSIVYLCSRLPYFRRSVHIACILTRHHGSPHHINNNTNGVLEPKSVQDSLLHHVYSTHSVGMQPAAAHSVLVTGGSPPLASTSRRHNRHGSHSRCTHICPHPGPIHSSAGDTDVTKRAQH